MNKLHPLHSVGMIIDYVNSTGDYFDPERATGRTEVLALEHISKAIKNPHRWVEFNDHHASTVANRYLGDRCKCIVQRLGYVGFVFTRDRMCFGTPPCRAY